MIKELREIKKAFIQHDPLPDFGSMDTEDALNVGLFMEEVIKTFVEFEERFKSDGVDDIEVPK